MLVSQQPCEPLTVVGNASNSKLRNIYGTILVDSDPWDEIQISHVWLDPSRRGIILTTFFRGIDATTIVWSTRWVLRGSLARACSSHGSFLVHSFSMFRSFSIFDLPLIFRPSLLSRKNFWNNKKMIIISEDLNNQFIMAEKTQADRIPNQSSISKNNRLYITRHLPSAPSKSVFVGRQ